jgi:hypothetical protein
VSSRKERLSRRSVELAQASTIVRLSAAGEVDGVYGSEAECCAANGLTKIRLRRLLDTGNSHAGPYGEFRLFPKVAAPSTALMETVKVTVAAEAEEQARVEAAKALREQFAPQALARKSFNLGPVVAARSRLARARAWLYAALRLDKLEPCAEAAGAAAAGVAQGLRRVRFALGLYQEASPGSAASGATDLDMSALDDKSLTPLARLRLSTQLAKTKAEKEAKRRSNRLTVLETNVASVAERDRQAEEELVAKIAELERALRNSGDAKAYAKSAASRRVVPRPNPVPRKPKPESKSLRSGARYEAAL